MKYFYLLGASICSFLTYGQSDYILSNLDSTKDDYAKIAMQIWEYAEMGYQGKE